MTELDQLSGIGETRAQQLRAAGIETVEDVQDADVADLQTVEGIGDSIASDLKEQAAEITDGGGSPGGLAGELIGDDLVDDPTFNETPTELGDGVDRDAHRRFLTAFNEARTPEQLAEMVDVEPERARMLLEHRTEYPIGVQHVDDLTGPDLIDEDILDNLGLLFGPARYGKWESPANLTTAHGDPFKPVHAALLHTGDVLFIKHTHGGQHGGGHGGGHTRDWTQVWDPAKKGGQSLSAPSNQPQADLYCSGHSFLSNGELLVVGGGGPSTGNEPDYGWKFDPDGGGGAGKWIRTQGGTNAGRVVQGRWYPTLVTVGPNRVLVVDGGHDKMSIYDQHADDFTEVSSPPGQPNQGPNDPSRRDFPPRYPGLHYTPSGKVIYTKTGFGNAGRGTAAPDPDKPQYFEFTSAREGRWSSPFPQPQDRPRTKGMSVQILKQGGRYGWQSDILVVGGASGSAARSVETLRPDTSPPSWRKHNFTFTDPRINVNATVLADGTVFVCGGTTSKNSPCYIYDPWATQNPWTEVAELPSVRNYHSFALLLPSAKVLVGSADTNSIEVYRPPYLYNGPTLASRPSIQSVPSRIHHGQSFTVTMSGSPSIDKLNLVRPMAVTHQTDSEQRAVPLQFSQNGSTLNATAPNGNHPHPVAPRGYYMLFAIDSNGVPSRGEFVHLH